MMKVLQVLCVLGSVCCTGGVSAVGANGAVAGASQTQEGGSVTQTQPSQAVTAGNVPANEGSGDKSASSGESGGLATQSQNDTEQTRAMGSGGAVAPAQPNAAAGDKNARVTSEDKRSAFEKLTFKFQVFSIFEEGGGYDGKDTLYFCTKKFTLEETKETFRILGTVRSDDEGYKEIIYRSFVFNKDNVLLTINGKQKTSESKSKRFKSDGQPSVITIDRAQSINNSIEEFYCFQHGDFCLLFEVVEGLKRYIAINLPLIVVTPDEVKDGKVIKNGEVRFLEKQDLDQEQPKLIEFFKKFGRCCSYILPELSDNFYNNYFGESYIDLYRVLTNVDPKTQTTWVANEDFRNQVQAEIIKAYKAAKEEATKAAKAAKEQAKVHGFRPFLRHGALPQLLKIKRPTPRLQKCEYAQANRRLLI